MNQLPDYFGSMVFNEEAMERYVSSDALSAWKKCLTDGIPLQLDTANDIAEGMKRWALEHGVTHYTHWFQPMTGLSAEKHDSFVSPCGHGKVMMDFSGKELVRGEPDASSFPSGGLRATFEARGYTAWDPTAFAFIKDGSLCIPTVFCSYSGEALDKKTPLLRSLDAVGRQALRVLRLFGDTETTRVISNVGPEQEYFLVDKAMYDRREDLRLCGRTLFGAKPPKGQELDDHYFGVIKPRVAAYMKDLDEELWKLGVCSKTKHNEAAPAQHEMAPVYTESNIACDHNQLTMDIMKRVASRHDLVCLLHEKPFAGVNGSGKHNNWSLGTDTGKNLFSPGKTPSQNAQFLLFLAAFIKGVDEYQELLRTSAATAGNDHRLGGNEAPPAIISIYLGKELDDIIHAITEGIDYVEVSKRSLRIGVDILPTIPQDTTDRNRTSPLAFTGNKFEFRMPGSNQSVSGHNVVLNTIMAEALCWFADRLENSKDFQHDLHELIRQALTEHKRIIFDGNGYDESWVQEAQRRGLANLRSCAEALPTYMMPKNIELFTKHGVYTESEMRARHEIHMESYCKVVNIEANTLIDMIQHQILNAASHYSAKLCATINDKRKALPNVSCRVEEALAESICHLNADLLDACTDLKTAINTIPSDAVGEARLQYFHDEVFLRMEKTRAIIDRLEALVAADFWPFPTYVDLLFGV